MEDGEGTLPDAIELVEKSASERRGGSWDWGCEVDASALKKDVVVEQAAIS